MGQVINFKKPDNPENVEALRAMVHAVRAAMGVGMDRDAFIYASIQVWDGVIAQDLADQLGGE